MNIANIISVFVLVWISLYVLVYYIYISSPSDDTKSSLEKLAPVPIQVVHQPQMETTRELMSSELDFYATTNPILPLSCQAYINTTRNLDFGSNVAVIIPTRDEAKPNVLRTILSVILNSGKLLTQVVVVDDHSRESVLAWKEWTLIEKNLHSFNPKLTIHLVRAAHHLGLPGSKDFGAKVLLGQLSSPLPASQIRTLSSHASSSVPTPDTLVFLDAHSVVSHGWLVPLVDQLSKHPHARVQYVHSYSIVPFLRNQFLVFPAHDLMILNSGKGLEALGLDSEPQPSSSLSSSSSSDPSSSSIYRDPNTVSFIQGSDGMVGGFDWGLNFRWEGIGPGTQGSQRVVGGKGSGGVGDANPQVDVALSPASPGILSMRTSYYTEIGGFDPLLGKYGPDNIELSIRVWLCGGLILRQSCSRVAHRYTNLIDESPPPSQRGVRIGDVDKFIMSIAERWIEDEDGEVKVQSVNKNNNNEEEGGFVWSKETVFQSRFLNRIPYTVDLPTDVHRSKTLEHAKPLVNGECLPFKWFLQEIYPGLASEAEQVREAFAAHLQSDYLKKAFQPLLDQYNKKTEITIDQQEVDKVMLRVNKKGEKEIEASHKSLIPKKVPFIHPEIVKKEMAEKRLERLRGRGGEGQGEGGGEERHGYLVGVISMPDEEEQQQQQKEEEEEEVEELPVEKNDSPPPPPPPENIPEDVPEEVLLDEHEIYANKIRNDLTCADEKPSPGKMTCAQRLKADPDACWTNREYMIFGCPKTCGLCAREDGKLCADFFENKCPQSKAQGNCALPYFPPIASTDPQELHRLHKVLTPENTPHVCRPTCLMCSSPGWDKLKERIQKQQKEEQLKHPQQQQQQQLPILPPIITSLHHSDSALPPQPPPGVPPYSLPLPSEFQGIDPYVSQRAFSSSSSTSSSNSQSKAHNGVCELNGKPHGELLSRIKAPPPPPPSSDLSPSQRPVRIFCGIYTMEKNHKTNVQATRDTWAHRCDGFLAFSTVSDPLLPAMKIDHEGDEAYDNMWQKSRSIWKFIGTHFANHFDFFVLGGDDMFYLIENLRAFLGSSEIDHYRQQTDRGGDKGLFLGRRFYPQGFKQDDLTSNVFNSGGAGYILDSSAVKLLNENLDKDFCFPHQRGFWEDVNVAYCLRKAGGILPQDTRDEQERERFHPFTPGQHLTYRIPKVNPDWYPKYNPWLKEGFDCCSDESVSFHYVPADLMYQLHDYYYLCQQKQLTANFGV